MREIYVQLLLVLFYLDFFLNKRSDDASSNKNLINKRMQEEFSWPPAAMNEDKRCLKDVANTMRELERPRQRPLKVLLHKQDSNFVPAKLVWLLLNSTQA